MVSNIYAEYLHYSKLSPRHHAMVHRALEQHFKLISPRFQPISSDRYHKQYHMQYPTCTHRWWQTVWYTLTYAGQSATRNFACAMPVYARMYNVRTYVCSYACMRNAFRWAPHPPTQPHNSLSDRPPEIYVPTPPLNGSVSSLYIHTHIQVLGMVCNTSSTCTQIEDCERRGHFHFSRRHCWSPEWNIPRTPFIKIALYRVQSKDNRTYPTWHWGIHKM